MKTMRKVERATPEKVLVLRTCNEDLTSHGGFRWPKSGKAKAPDWSPVATCGHGLHGLLWGEGAGSLLNWGGRAKWLVVEVLKSKIVDLNGKVKFPDGKVVFCGERLGATKYLLENGAIGRSICGGTSTSGDGGIIQVKYWDERYSRYRIKSGYVGEDGLKPRTKYRLDGRLNFMEVTA